MPHFCDCCAEAHDTYICQQCGVIKCSGRYPGTWGKVPRSGREGNLCPTCAEDATANAPVEAKLIAQELFARQEQIYGDACDIGIRIDGGKRTDLRVAVRELIKKYKPKVSKWHCGREYDFGSFTITWCKDQARHVEFLMYMPA